MPSSTDLPSLPVAFTELGRRLNCETRAVSGSEITIILTVPSSGQVELTLRPDNGGAGERWQFLLALRHRQPAHSPEGIATVLRAAIEEAAKTLDLLGR